MIGDVGGAEGEFAVGVTLLRLGLGELGVLDDAEGPSPASDDADRLGRLRLGDDLGAALRLLGDAVAEEGRVRDTDEAVVDAVGVDEADLALGDDGEDGARVGGRDGSAEGRVDAAVSIGGKRDLGGGREKDLAVLSQAREDS